jgi:hypothetical protein
LTDRKSERPCLFFACLALVAFISACDSGSGPPVNLVDVGAAVDDVFRLAFADHGKQAFVNFRKTTVTGPIEDWHDWLAVIDVGSWTPIHEFEADSTIGNGFSCADDRVVMFDVGRQAQNGLEYTIEAWDIVQDIQLATHVGTEWPLPHDSPWGPTWPHLYECDPGSNTMFFRLHKDRVIALDGTTGELLREYLDPGQTEYFDFFIQPEQDRLVWVEYQAITAIDTEFPAEVRVYRLSTAELVGSVDIMQGAILVAPAEYLYLDRDHIAMLTGAIPNVCTGITMKLVDLAGPTIEQVRCIQDRRWGGGLVLGKSPPLVVVGANRSNGCLEIRSMDLWSGEEGPVHGLCTLGDPFFTTYPSLDRILVLDYAPAGGGNPLWYLYDFPGFSSVGQGRDPENWDSGKFTSARGLEVLQRYEDGKMGIFDAEEARYQDTFKACDMLVPDAIRVDPSGRWAATLCRGDWHGLAVIDLDWYRPSSSQP